MFVSQLPIFDKDGGKDGHLDDDDDEDQADLSDSEESIFSGLEESGSDSDDEEEDEDDEEEEAGSEEKSSDVEENKATSAEGEVQPSAKDVTKPQVIWTSMLMLQIMCFSGACSLKLHLCGLLRAEIHTKL